MKSEEKAHVVARGAGDADEHIVGLDALAVYVHKRNPLNTISIKELAEIYGDGGTINNWSQLGGGTK
jgi:phosphate transport system substrate-binding protein